MRFVVFLCLSLFAHAAHADELDAPGDVPAEVIEATLALRSRSPERRSAAAADLVDDEYVHPWAVPFLLNAAVHETDRAAYIRILRALGFSGAMEARRIIDLHVLSPDDSLRAVSRRALRDWLVKNELWDEDERLPEPPHRVYGPPPTIEPTLPAATSLQARAAADAIPPLASPPAVYFAPPPGTPWGAEVADLGVPPGFEEFEERRAGAVVAGAVLLAGAYVGSIAGGIFGMVDSGAEYAPLLFPVAGPFVAAGTADSFDDRVGEGILLVILGIAQTGGLATLLPGVFATRTRVRPTGPRQLVFRF